MIKLRLPSISAPLITAEPTPIFSPETNRHVDQPIHIAQTAEKVAQIQVGYCVVIDKIVVIANSTITNIRKVTIGFSIRIIVEYFPSVVI
jgi:hypothetical protein